MKILLMSIILKLIVESEEDKKLIKELINEK